MTSKPERGGRNGGKMNTPSVNSRRRSGFTLVEVVLAAVILGVILLGLGFFFANIINQSTKVEDMSEALQLARQGLEEIRTEDITALTIGRTGPEIIGEYERYMEVSVVDSILINARKIRCIVIWDGIAGADSVSFTTIF
jgi:prepilin-type N-terminal cleavage/methylation domain-containing protein